MLFNYDTFPDSSLEVVTLYPMYISRYIFKPSLVLAVIVLNFLDKSLYSLLPASAATPSDSSLTSSSTSDSSLSKESEKVKY